MYTAMADALIPTWDPADLMQNTIASKAYDNARNIAETSLRRGLSLDSINPSYRNIITCTCLKVDVFSNLFNQM